MRLKTKIKKQRSGYVTIKIPKPDVPKGLFRKCKKCGQMVLSEDVKIRGIFALNVADILECMPKEE